MLLTHAGNWPDGSRSNTPAPPRFVLHQRSGEQQAAAPLIYTASPASKLTRAHNTHQPAPEYSAHTRPRPRPSTNDSITTKCKQRHAQAMRPDDTEYVRPTPPRAGWPCRRAKEGAAQQDDGESASAAAGKKPGCQLGWCSAADMCRHKASHQRIFRPPRRNMDWKIEGVDVPARRVFPTPPPTPRGPGAPAGPRNRKRAREAGPAMTPPTSLATCDSRASLSQQSCTRMRSSSCPAPAPTHGMRALLSWAYERPENNPPAKEPPAAAPPAHAGLRAPRACVQAAARAQRAPGVRGVWLLYRHTVRAPQLPRPAQWRATAARAARSHQLQQRRSLKRLPGALLQAVCQSAAEDGRPVPRHGVPSEARAPGRLPGCALCRRRRCCCCCRRRRRHPRAAHRRQQPQTGPLLTAAPPGAASWPSWQTSPAQTPRPRIAAAAWGSA
jgi:hypothetical protein